LKFKLVRTKTICKNLPDIFDLSTSFRSEQPQLKDDNYIKQSYP